DLPNLLAIESGQLGKTTAAFGVVMELIETWRARRKQDHPAWFRFSTRAGDSIGKGLNAEKLAGDLVRAEQRSDPSAARAIGDDGMRRLPLDEFGKGLPIQAALESAENDAHRPTGKAAQGFDGGLRRRRDAVVDPGDRIAHAQGLQAMRQGPEGGQVGGCRGGV